MRTLKATVSYDGTDFSGFQRQANARSVQAELEAVLGTIDGQPVTVSGAGRTDAGVHALGQVVSFRLDSAIGPMELQRAMNARLPVDVRVHDIEEREAGFDARFSARSKAYRYRISNTPVLSPFERRFTWHISRRLDLDAMRAGALELLGRHDFSSFQARGGTVRSAVRLLTRSVWTEEPVADGRLLTYEVAGSGFLKYMVRTIVGTLVEVGDGRRTPAAIREIVASRHRPAAGPTAPPQGLYLVRVDYDPAGPVSFF